MKIYFEYYVFKLNNEKFLKIRNDNVLSFEVDNALNSLHLKFVVRLSGFLISERKENFFIFIHLIDGIFIQIDNMFCFLNEEEYVEC